jgi:hypothetical protein
MPAFAFPTPPADLATYLLRRCNAPLPIYTYVHIPRLRHRTYARLLSTRHRSTSELLRTLQMNGCFQANILAVSAAPLRYCLQLSPDFGALDGGLSCSSFGRGP